MDKMFNDIKSERYSQQKVRKMKISLECSDYSLIEKARGKRHSLEKTNIKIFKAR